MQIRNPMCCKSPEKAPKIFGQTWVLCYRCTFISLGVATVFLPGFSIVRSDLLGACFLTLLMIPCVIDGCHSYGQVGTTNFRRSITGLLAGIGLGQMASMIGEGVFSFA